MTRQSFLFVMALVLCAFQLPLTAAESTSVSAAIKWPPRVLLDDFTKWDGGLNNYGLNRTFSEGAVRGNGQIILGKNQYYNALFSTGNRTLYNDYLGIRIVYSMDVASDLVLQLIHLEEKSVPNDGQSLPQIKKPTFIEHDISAFRFQFRAGKEIDINIPITYFAQKNDKFSYEKATALKIPGNITIHRVELGIEDGAWEIYSGPPPPARIIHNWQPTLFLQTSMQLIVPRFTLTTKSLQEYFHDLLQKANILTKGQIDVTFGPGVSNEAYIELFKKLSDYIKNPDNNLLLPVGGKSEDWRIHESPRDGEHYQIVGYILGMAFVNKVDLDIPLEVSIIEAILTDPNDIKPQVKALRCGIQEIILKEYFPMFSPREFGEILSGKILRPFVYKAKD